MKPNDYKYLFGPVPSRRFGRSLGIDLTPHKKCSLDCVFCQLGRTGQKSVSRENFVPIGEVLAEIAHWLEHDGSADYLTLSGSGEPTLHAGFGQVLDYLKDKPIPSVLLTNGTLLTDPEVRRAAGLAKVVKVSLSAWDQASFEWVNRPHETLCFDRVVDGLRKFRENFDGRLWLEVFLLAGMNAMPGHVEKIAAIAKTFKPHRIHLNTIARPPAEDFAAPVSMAQMQTLVTCFNPPAEIAAGFSTNRSQRVIANEANILSMLKRRPCTMKQIEDAFGLHINEVSKVLGQLMQADQICADLRNQDVYYRCAFTSQPEKEANP